MPRRLRVLSYVSFVRPVGVSAINYAKSDKYSIRFDGEELALVRKESGIVEAITNAANVSWWLEDAG